MLHQAYADASTFAEFAVDFERSAMGLGNKAAEVKA